MSEWIKIDRNTRPAIGNDVQVYCSDTNEQFVAFLTTDGKYQYAQYAGTKFSCYPSHYKPLSEGPEV